jgi:hypothetical protein
VDRRQRQAVTERSAAEIEAGATRCANALRARGVAAGDAVGVWLADGDARQATLRACARLDATPICTAQEADALPASVVGLVHERRNAERVAAARRALPALRVVLSVDDGSDADLTHAGSEDFESALAGAASS